MKGETMYQGEHVEFKLSKKGIKELLQSEPVLDLLNDCAISIAAEAGEGYEVEPAHPIRFTSVTSVEAKSFRARLDNSSNNTLLKISEKKRF